MFDFLFWITYVLLWILVVSLTLAVYLLYRHHGQLLLNSREGRSNQGPELYRPLPLVQLHDTAGSSIQLGQSQSKAMLIFFGSTKCKPCQEARTALGMFAKKHAGLLEVLVVCEGNSKEVLEFTDKLPNVIRIVADTQRQLMTRFRVSATPFAFIANREGVVVGKGMPATTEAFEWFVDQLAQPPEKSQASVSEIPVSAIRTKV